MLKQIKTTRYNIQEADVIFDEIADLVQHVDEMSLLLHRNFTPSPKQQELDDLIRYSETPEDQPLHILLWGSVGSAKSTAAFWIVTKGLLAHPGAICLAARDTQTNIEKTLWQKTQDFFNTFNIPFTKNFKSLRILLKNGSSIQMQSADRTKKSKNDTADDLGSTEYSYAILEECNAIPPEFANTVPGRMRQEVGVRRKVIFYICNPPSKDHWLYEKFFVDHNPNDPKSRYRALQMLTKDNPFVSDGYKTSIHSDYADNPMLYLRMVRGEFGPNVKGHPIFQKHFNPVLHIATSEIHKNWDPNQTMYRCWDFGFLHPAIVVFQDDAVTGQLRIFEAILGDKILLDPFADAKLHELHKIYPGANWIDCVDPSGSQKRDVSEKSSIDILKSKGLIIKTKRHTIEYGLSIIAEQLSTIVPYRKGPQSAVLIDPKARLLIEALQFGYCQEKDIPKDVLKPVKDGTYDHVMDALRYGMIIVRRPKQGKTKDYSRGDQYVPATNPTKFVAGEYKDPGIPRKVIVMGGDTRPTVQRPPSYGFNRSNFS